MGSTFSPLSKRFVPFNHLLECSTLWHVLWVVTLWIIVILLLPGHLQPAAQLWWGWFNVFLGLGYYRCPLRFFDGLWAFKQIQHMLLMFFLQQVSPISLLLLTACLPLIQSIRFFLLSKQKMFSPSYCKNSDTSYNLRKYKAVFSYFPVKEREFECTCQILAVNW